MPQRRDSPLPLPGQLTTGLFRMRKKYARWRESGSPGWLLIYTLGGQGRFGHAEGDLLVRKGDVVLLKPKTRHDYGLENTLRSWDLLWAYFFPPTDWLPLLNWPEEASGILRIHLSDSSILSRVKQQTMDTHRLNTTPHRQRERLARNALEKTLLLCDSVNPLAEQAPMDPRVRRAVDYLGQNFAKAITIDKLARLCGLSASRLAHLFRTQVGETPHHYLEMRRMNQARQLLDLTQQPVGAIAAETGFPDLFHFSKRFKHHFGLSPRHFRAQSTSD